MGDRGYHQRHDRPRVREQARQDIPTFHRLSPITPPSDLFTEIEKAVEGTKKARERYFYCINKADEDLMKYIKSRCVLPIPMGHLESFWEEVERSRKEARKAREDYYVWCKHGEKMRVKLGKDVLGFLVKELNSVNAVVGKLQDERMVRRGREESTGEVLGGFVFR
ncbi:uncharacterized protein EAF01_006300 [Botrytis porri]|uniref:Uncharacterized protein n=1 Tax=Botrytis porri TaxID=87229 RepID=A0A4Z1KHU6_9HELO|nr:uncharacterized protein EAF01_006300 [Botrytis porri]KAF7903251.1 hypothetical protein EAF01_006300 [Botrytis porri]TGO84916.1 hypothetical protein BPOR_0451g00060 [Botrytis porri]